jgi:hypothetical protein
MTDTTPPLRDELEWQKWQAQQEFEREKWRGESNNRDQDFQLKREELRLKDEDLKLRSQESRRARWNNPLIIAILGATAAGIANLIVNAKNNNYQLELEDKKSKDTFSLERDKAESIRILEVIKTGNAEQTRTNLRFLAETGLISDSNLAAKLKSIADDESHPVPSLTSIAVPTVDSSKSLNCEFNPKTKLYDLCHVVPR